jgi:diacylglycerol kinase (ATP)
MNERVCVLLNPASGRGRGARLEPRIRAAFGALGVGDVRRTAASGDERTLALAAIEEGFTTLAAVGGDGTWSRVGDAILESGADRRLALISAGTGNDFAKTLGVPSDDIESAARLALEGPDRRVDVGRIEGRHFLNIAGFGFDIAVLEDIERIGWLSGNALYLFSALRQLLGYRGIEIDIASPAARRARARHLMLIVANARHFGGAFHIAPGAALDDGALDAISVHDAPPLRRLTLFQAAQRGTHVALPEVVAERAARFTLRFDRPPSYETDGEYHRAASAELEVTCVPGALRVVAPPPGPPAT